MIERKLLEGKDMEDIDRRIAAMGLELYQLLEDYPILDQPEGGYVASLMFWHQRIYDDAMKLKKAAITAEKERRILNTLPQGATFDVAFEEWRGGNPVSVLVGGLA